MKLFQFIIVFSALVFGSESYKLILTTQNSHEDITPYLEACMHEMQNPLLQEQKLSCSVEYLGEDNMIVITPIDSKLLKRQLVLRLYPHYRDMFFVPIYKKDFFSRVVGVVKTVGLEWVALLLLSFIGLIGSFFRRYQMGSFEKEQKRLIQKQKALENEMKGLGVSDE